MDLGSIGAVHDLGVVAGDPCAVVRMGIHVDCGTRNCDNWRSGGGCVLGRELRRENNVVPGNSRWDRLLLLARDAAWEDCLECVCNGSPR